MTNTRNLFLSVINVLTLCIVIFFVSLFFIYDAKWIGFVIVILGVICLLSLKLFKIKVLSVFPDIIFGVIDNGVLAIMSLLGGEIAGMMGAVIGGVVGNAITDGIAGLFEGYVAEKNNVTERTIVGSAVGKMAGCLLGAGVVMIIFFWIEAYILPLTI